MLNVLRYARYVGRRAKWSRWKIASCFAFLVVSELRYWRHYFLFRVCRVIRKGETEPN